MRVCIFTDTIGDLNGVSRFIQDMGEQALLHGFDLHIVSSTAKYCPVAPNIHNLAPAWRIPMPFYRELDIAFPSLRSLEKKLLELRPDILHISTPGPVGILAKRLAAKHNLPVMGTYHTDFPAYIGKNTGLEVAKRMTDRLMARFYRHFRHVFTRSREYLAIMQKEIAIPLEKSSILPPGTNLERFHPRFRDPTVFRRFGLTEEGLKVLYVGRVSKEKNIPFLLEVWKQLAERNPALDAELLLAGEGSLRRKAEQYRPFGIRFLGPVVGETLSRLYASSDLFVFPSVTDTLGQVVMEAQASALCAVVSDIGGPQSIVHTSKNPGGLVVPGNDTEAWTDTIEMLLENATLRHHYAARGFENMRTFDITDSFRHFASTHTRLLAHRTPTNA